MVLYILTLSHRIACANGCPHHAITLVATIVVQQGHVPCELARVSDPLNVLPLICSLRLIGPEAGLLHRDGCVCPLNSGRVTLGQLVGH